MRSALPAFALLLAACAASPASPGPAAPGPAPMDLLAPSPMPSADTLGAVQTRALPVTADLAYEAAAEAAAGMGWVLSESDPAALTLKVGVPEDAGRAADVFTVVVESRGGGSLVTVRSALADRVEGALEDEQVVPHVGAYLDALADLVSL